MSPEALAASAGVSSRCAGGSLRCSGSATNLLQTQQQGLGVAAGFAAAGGNPMAAGLHGSQPLSPGLSQQAPPQQREEEGEEEASGGEGKEEGGSGDEAAACLPPPQVLLPPPPLPLDPSSQLFEGSMSQAEVADAADVFYDLKHEAAAAEEKEEEAAAEEGGTAATEATEEGGETTAAAAAAAAAPGAVEPSFPRLVESQHIDAALNPGEVSMLLSSVSVSCHLSCPPRLPTCPPSPPHPTPPHPNAVPSPPLTHHPLLTPHPMTPSLPKQNNVGGGETITGTGFYGTINAACTMQIFLVLFGILSGAFAWPVMFDAGVGLGRPLVAAFTRGLCAYAYGNDSCPSRVDKAIKFMRMFVEFIKGKGVNVTAQFLARRPAVFAMTMEVGCVVGWVRGWAGGCVGAWVYGVCGVCGAGVGTCPTPPPSPPSSLAPTHVVHTSSLLPCPPSLLCPSNRTWPRYPKAWRASRTCSRSGRASPPQQRMRWGPCLRPRPQPWALRSWTKEQECSWSGS